MEPSEHAAVPIAGICNEPAADGQQPTQPETRAKRRRRLQPQPSVVKRRCTVASVEITAGESSHAPIGPSKALVRAGATTRIVPAAAKGATHNSSKSTGAVTTTAAAKTDTGTDTTVAKVSVATRIIASAAKGATLSSSQAVKATAAEEAPDTESAAEAATPPPVTVKDIITAAAESTVVTTTSEEATISGEESEPANDPLGDETEEDGCNM